MRRKPMSIRYVTDNVLLIEYSGSTGVSQFIGKQVNTDKMIRHVTLWYLRLWWALAFNCDWYSAVGQKVLRLGIWVTDCSVGLRQWSVLWPSSQIYICHECLKFVIVHSFIASAKLEVMFSSASFFLSVCLLTG